MTDADRAAEVWDRLGRVTDPELDESVTELRFVTDVAVAPDGAVSMQFRLPTYWCAANFAFLMADDMRREVAALPWVTRVDLHLGDHMYADTINAGLRSGATFEDAFGASADGDLAALRRTFLVKAFQRRQEALLRHLLDAGQAAEALARLSAEALDGLALSEAGSALRRRYLERRPVCAGPDEMLAFVDEHGAALRPGELPIYLRALGRVGVNAEFNGALCRGLLAARFNEPSGEPAAEPTLQDFVRQAAQRQADHAGRMA